MIEFYIVDIQRVTLPPKKTLKFEQKLEKVLLNLR